MGIVDFELLDPDGGPDEPDPEFNPELADEWGDVSGVSDPHLPQYDDREDG